MSEMGTGEMGTPTKTTKTSTAPQQQETPPVSTPQPYTDWAAAFQAYYGSGAAPMPPHGYFPSSVGSGPQPHPYMWGPQHLMAPYTPPPYAAMYAHGGIYGHPSIPPGTHPYSPYALPPGSTADAQGNTTPASADGDGKLSEGKKTKNSLKRSKGSLGSLGMLTGKGSESGKGSMSADSGSEGSTEGSEGTSQNGSDGGHKGADQVATSTPYGSGQDGNHATIQALPLSIAGKQVMGAGPLTNLNIGMDYWNGGAPTVLANSGGKRPTPGTTTALIPSGVGLGRDVVSSDLWQDERELKRQRRKQSNRESARRSRLRKQAECEELSAKVHTLEAENTTLRSELTSIREQCNKLSAENRSLVEEMQMRGVQPETADSDIDRKNMNNARGERRDTGHMQADNEHFRRDGRVVNDAFSVANDGGNLAVSVSSG